MRTTIPGLVLILSTVPVASPLVGQNLVTNGDFQSGNTTGWTFGGYAMNPKVMAFDTTGTGSSLGFSNRPGSKAKTLPPGGSYTMEQNVMLVQGVLHLMVADIAVANTQPLTNVDAGDFTFFADGVQINKVKLKGIFPNEIKRRQVCIRFVPQSTGSKPLKIEFYRAWGAQPTTPRHHIDNIVLLRLPPFPLACPRGERKLRTQLTIDVYGTAGWQFVMFVGASRVAQPVAIPGFKGTWSLPLPPASLPVLFGSFDNAGSFRLVAPLAPSANALAGVPLHWQGIEGSSNAPPTLGTVNSFGIYP